VTGASNLAVLVYGWEELDFLLSLFLEFLEADPYMLFLLIFIK
jgi:hypothetical protein